MARAALAAAVALIGFPAAAGPGTPGPAYFAGSYEWVGRDAGAGMRNVPAQIEAQGRDVVIRTCGAGDVTMGFGPAFEIENLMTGQMAGPMTGFDTVLCLFHNNGYNRPILTCRSDAGAAFTLWPVTSAPLPCLGGP